MNFPFGVVPRKVETMTSTHEMISGTINAKVFFPLGRVQPYGLVLPPSYRPDTAHRFRLDCWFHGRGERSTESNFIFERMHQIGRFAPRDTFVLHPFGRYSNAFKFAGEVDVFEALDHVRAN